MDDRKNLPDHETLNAANSQQPKTRFRKFTEKKLLYLRLTDFLHRQESEEAAVDRAIRQIQDDPKIRQAMPADLKSLPFHAKKAIALMYSEVSGSDIFGTSELPNIVFWLQRAAVTHDENEYFAQASNRDAVCSGSSRSFLGGAEG